MTEQRCGNCKYHVHDEGVDFICNCEESDNRFPVYYHGEGKDWHKTKESALAKAEEMRKKRIASLNKQIEKLEKLRFE